ncbi:DUF6969 family protein [Sphingorhabdus arenilitoris]|uniref:DUF6969 family protein n=1 Tax=Sphingorhabdus arenilitoris TaxID=1490041 RepID=A0ABV8RE69_9SPHN
MNQVDAAHIVIETIMAMVKDGRPLMKRVLPDDEVHWWEHYPKADARDKHTKSRWYYHVHAPGDRDPEEHGHFHLFLHLSQLDDGVTPIISPQKKGDTDPVQTTHVAALAIDHNGIPRQWFTTNRWVTEEYLFPAETMIAHLDRYNVDETEEDSIVNRFVTAMVALYRDEISQLLMQRDQKLKEIGAGPDNPLLFEKGNDVLSACDIDLDAKLESLGIE